MSKWEDQVKVSLDDIFDSGDNKKTDTKKDSYSKMSNDEINEVYEKVNTQEDPYLEDINEYYSENEQLDLASKGIQLTTAKEYKLDTNKKPIWKNRITNKFKNWLKDQHPEMLEFIEKEEDTINDFGVDKKQKNVHSKKKEKKLITSKELKEKIRENGEIRVLKQELSWLYKFMEHLEFVDYEPNDEDMKHIEKIDGMVNNG